MVLIAVAGGTGLAGRAVIEEVLARGHKVRSLTRRPPSAEARVAGAEYVHCDFHTGEGVAAGLLGVDALVETLDARSGAGLRALPVTSVAVLNAAAAAGVKRCVLLTIVRAGECSVGYYQAQAARALSYEHSGMATSVVYSTQFHNLLAGIFSAGAKVGVIPAFRGVSFQTIATADVARVLVGEALVEDPGHRPVLAGGPEVQAMAELAKEWKGVTGSKARVTTMPLPGSFGTFLRLGKNLIPEHAVGQQSFGQWLQSMTHVS
ncbi:SDR family oxidoreductase [Arthrobacter glacialis]|uniref:SDR family oxidoreductase n=1 Tax=Arthrobacter glacialis TaxID=1664 RepID=UPI000CD3CFC8|nr:NAD(P)H-binding protein [Arthrobacter glacialis]POH57617.1 NmrA family transcriptional regulator [Arthrobacter glacialis]